jgi:predicted nuclease with TOPRIM domain
MYAINETKPTDLEKLDEKIADRIVDLTFRQEDVESCIDNAQDDIIDLNAEVVELRETVEDMQDTIQELQDKLEELTDG